MGAIERYVFVPRIENPGRGICDYGATIMHMFTHYVVYAHTRCCMVFVESTTTVFF
jgi:hypothetical protein